MVFKSDSYTIFSDSSLAKDTFGVLLVGYNENETKKIVHVVVFFQIFSVNTGEQDLSIFSPSLCMALDQIKHSWGVCL